MAIFHGRQRISGRGRRWNLTYAGDKPKKDRDYRGRFVERDPPIPERFKEPQKKKGWW
jgi:hypothetical protein